MVAKRLKGQKRWPVIPGEVRRQVIGLAKEGYSRSEILEMVDISVGSYLTIMVPLGGVLSPDLVAEPVGHRLSLEDRFTIKFGLETGRSYQQIADSLSRPFNKSSIWREVARNGGRRRYKPMAAQRRAHEQARRAKPTKLAANPELLAIVAEMLQRLWSPAQIAAKLRERYGDDATMTVSHETIYKSLYVQGRGELRKELAQCLRTGRAKRKTRNRVESRGRIPDMVSISERPAEVEDRAVPGHWEGDLILGKNGKSAVGTLVERTTRFVMLLHLPEDHTATTVRDAMTAAIVQLPEQLRRSVTWDQGKEMAQHVRFTVDTGIPVYFADPHSPWQRGSNENTNGLLRQYMPKGTDLSQHTPDALAEFALSLNTRPRKTLGWKSPAEALSALLVAPTP